MPYPIALTHNLDHLRLDYENPRLPSDLVRSNDSIVDYLTRQAAIEDLALSIAENGFFFAEALVAVPVEHLSDADIGPDTPLIIVEGNRRLTALKLLQDPTLSSRSIFQKIAAQAEHKPTNIPVIVYENRDAVLQFLGYRHITGVKPWDPLAKARYIEQLFNRLDPSLDFIDRYREVAQMVGSKPQYVRRSLNAIEAFNIYRNSNRFGLDLAEDDLDFSLVLTALGYSEIQKFLFKSADLENTNIFEKSSEVAVDRLADLFTWMYVPTRTGTTRLVESRNIKKLADIVASDRARELFYEGANIDVAYVSSRGSENEFREHLQDATGFLDAASRLVAFVEYSPSLEELARQGLTQATHIHKTVLSKKE